MARRRSGISTSARTASSGGWSPLPGMLSVRQIAEPTILLALRIVRLLLVQHDALRHARHLAAVGRAGPMRSEIFGRPSGRLGVARVARDLRRLAAQSLIKADERRALPIEEPGQHRRSAMTAISRPDDAGIGTRRAPQLRLIVLVAARAGRGRGSGPGSSISSIGSSSGTSRRRGRNASGVETRLRPRLRADRNHAQPECRQTDRAAACASRRRAGVGAPCMSARNAARPRRAGRGEGGSGLRRGRYRRAAACKAAESREAGRAPSDLLRLGHRAPPTVRRRGVAAGRRCGEAAPVRQRRERLSLGAAAARRLGLDLADRLFQRQPLAGDLRLFERPG